MIVNEQLVVVGDLTYTGIGSRNTPNNILRIMYYIGMVFGEHGYKLRSGAAGGADIRFELGHKSVSNNAEIFLPWKGFRKSIPDCRNDIVLDKTTMELCLNILEESGVAPKVRYFKPGVQKLFARNVMQVLGPTLNKPSDVVVLWAPLDKHGRMTGGTRVAGELAQQYEIPTYNLYVEKELQAFRKRYFAPY